MASILSLYLKGMVVRIIDVNKVLIETKESKEVYTIEELKEIVKVLTKIIEDSKNK